VILAVSNLRTAPTDTVTSAVPYIAAVAASVAVHLWRHSALLSIIGGTLVHVILATALHSS
jgi:branched-subunit amino acid transport protein AzlD